MADFVIVKSKLRDFAEGMNVSSDFAESLDKKVKVLIKEAVGRAKANKRSTIQPRDL